MTAIPRADPTSSSQVDAGPRLLAGSAYRFAVAALMAAALAIRLTNLDFGLPAEYHPDEFRKARVIQQTIDGEPHTYLNHPGLLMNSVALACIALRGLGLDLDVVSIILTGRFLVAVVGALTVLPTAALATTLFGGGAGLFAGAALAFSPLHTLHSRYLKEDVYLTFWVVVGLWALARWLQLAPEGRDSTAGRRWMLAALSASGLALASKYVGGIAVLFVAVVWRWHGGVSWRRLLGHVAAVAAIPILATPQVLTSLRQGRAGVYSFFWELQHGVAGGRDGLTLYFWEWPDLGAYFLVHGLGWGVSWPLAVLAIAALAVVWRRRRSADPALLVVAAAALLWYAVGEATPLKRGGDAERYIMPCAPIWTVLAAGWLTGWRSVFDPASLGASAAPRWLLAAAVALLALPLGHSLLLTAGIDDDTRRSAALWLREHGPRPPYRVLFLGDSAYQLEGDSIDGVTMLHLRRRNLLAELDRAIERAAVVTFSELDGRRYELSAVGSGVQLAARQRLREAFPVSVTIRKPFYLKGGVHNPDIELRMRAEPPSAERVP